MRRETDKIDQGSPDPNPPKDRRATSRALTLWQGAGGNGEIPTLDDFDPSKERDSGPYSFLLKEDPDPRLSVFILCGDGAESRFLAAPVGQTLWEVAPRQIRTELCAACGRARAESQPIQVEGSYAPAEGGEIRYRSIFMPVRSNAVTETGYVYGAYNSKRFDTAGTDIA